MGPAADADPVRIRHAGRVGIAVPLAREDCSIAGLTGLSGGAGVETRHRVTSNCDAVDFT